MIIFKSEEHKYVFNKKNAELVGDKYFLDDNEKVSYSEEGVYEDFEVLSYKQACAVCNSHRDPGKLCNCSTSCSGFAPSNLAKDYKIPLPEGYRHYRGGTHGSCHFVVKE